jgi:hypothetical protein
MYNKRIGKTKVISAEAFEYERSYLVKLSPHLPSPYLVHERVTDQYGYAALGKNYYWVPGTKRDKVKLIEYAERLKIYHQRECIAEYGLPKEGVKNEKFSPLGQPKPRHKPRHCKPTETEEKNLRSIDQTVNAYLDFALKPMGLKRHGFIRKLFGLSRKMTPTLFVKSIERAHRYKITNIETIERIALLYMQDRPMNLPLAEIDEEFRERDAYQEGYLTDQPNLSVYENLLEEEQDG